MWPFKCADEQRPAYEQDRIARPHPESELQAWDCINSLRVSMSNIEDRIDRVERVQLLLLNHLGLELVEIPPQTKMDRLMLRRNGDLTSAE